MLANKGMISISLKDKIPLLQESVMLSCFWGDKANTGFEFYKRNFCVLLVKYQKDSVNVARFFSMILFKFEDLLNGLNSKVLEPRIKSWNSVVPKLYLDFFKLIWRVQERFLTNPLYFAYA